jgi:hypothetical protein
MKKQKRSTYDLRKEEKEREVEGKELQKGNYRELSQDSIGSSKSDLTL